MLCFAHVMFYSKCKIKKKQSNTWLVPEMDMSYSNIPIVRGADRFVLAEIKTKGLFLSPTDPRQGKILIYLKNVFCIIAGFLIALFCVMF